MLMASCTWSAVQLGVPLQLPEVRPCHLARHAAHLPVQGPATVQDMVHSANDFLHARLAPDRCGVAEQDVHCTAAVLSTKRSAARRACAR